MHYSNKMDQDSVKKEIKPPTKILLVEDDDDIREFMDLVLNNYGFEVTLSSDGIDALSKYSSSIDLVITDLNMPLMGGLDLIKEIKTYNDNAKILIITANCLSTLPKDIAVLYKPFSIIQLMQNITETLEGKDTKGIKSLSSY